MRKIFQILLPLMIVVSISISCESVKDEEPAVSHLGKWDLVHADGTMIPTSVPVSDLGYTESYEFFPDGTFTKTNSELERILTGTYEVSPAEDEWKNNYQSSMTLTYNASDLEGLASNESGTVYMNSDPHFWIIYGVIDTEVLFLHENETLTNPGYGWSDGPIYVYMK